jgi:hypothetical protein
MFHWSSQAPIVFSKTLLVIVLPIPSLNPLASLTPEKVYLVYKAPYPASKFPGLGALVDPAYKSQTISV